MGVPARANRIARDPGDPDKDDLPRFTPLGAEDVA